MSWERGRKAFGQACSNIWRRPRGSINAGGLSQDLLLRRVNIRARRPAQEQVYGTMRSRLQLFSYTYLITQANVAHVPVFAGRRSHHTHFS